MRASVGITVGMVAGQLLDVGKNTLFKKATNNGMSKFVFLVYSNALAFSFLLPCTLLYYRHTHTPRPPISTSIICRIFLLAFLGCVAQTCVYGGMTFSSPTLVSAISDLVPAFTFILAIASRMENLDLKQRSSQVKSIGTVVSIAGALIVTLYQGLPIIIVPQPHEHSSGVSLSYSQQSNWLLGAILIAASSFCVSVFLVVQRWTLKDYPAELMVGTIFSSFSAILSAIVALFAERNPKAWILKPDMELVAVFYYAILLVSMHNILYAWACRKKGPVYVAIFNPLGMVIALCMGVIFLGDTLYLGRMIGCVIIAIGFYAVIWGQDQEEKMMNHKDNEISDSVSSSAAPLLHNKSMDV